MSNAMNPISKDAFRPIAQALPLTDNGKPERIITPVDIWLCWLSMRQCQFLLLWAPLGLAVLMFSSFSEVFLSFFNASQAALVSIKNLFQ